MRDILDYSDMLGTYVFDPKHSMKAYHPNHVPTSNTGAGLFILDSK